MQVAIVTGSCGLVGYESARLFGDRGFKVIGIDNDARRSFFGDSASTQWCRKHLEEVVPDYTHFSLDIRERDAIQSIFSRYSSSITVIIHSAAQPSHDWAAQDPWTDFSINATGTAVLLDATLRYSPESCFVFTSTNKVYGDTPNSLPLLESSTRYELNSSHSYFKDGIDETMSIDQSLHSLMGASKLAADVLVQEYGRYFGLKAGVFRCGCITGSHHSGAQLHGFLSYLMHCAVTQQHYSVLGYKGKQVRDNIHARDLAEMFWQFFRNPGCGEVYNAGGGRLRSCSVLEAIQLCEEITGHRLRWEYTETNRLGDHMWWISNVQKFRSRYPEWSCQYDLGHMLEDLYEGWKQRVSQY